MNPEADRLAQLIAEAKHEKAHAEVLLGNAQHRAEVYTFDWYVEDGKRHYYPQGKAALTRLRKRETKLRRLSDRLASLEAQYAKAITK